jgi:beta-glucosidase/6-phospho-beta-glucosidase/beta-galactosidase
MVLDPTLPGGAEFPQFAVACGEEGSDPVVVHRGERVRVDEFAASGHELRRDQDLADVAGLGVRVWRYGYPWRLTERVPGVYDWSGWDEALAACERHGLEPVVDLCHFGLPDHLGGFCDTDWIEPFCRYVDAFLDRYSEPMWFTPINEPGITALASGLLGAWNDRRASRGDYFLALANVVTANLEAIARIRGDRDGWWIGAEGFGAYVGTGDENVQRAKESRALQQIVWDLHFGLDLPSEVSDFHDLVSEGQQERLRQLAIGPQRVIAGHDFYPVGVTTFGGKPLIEYSIADRVETYRVEAAAWFERYQVPFWVSETSNLGLPVDQQTEWLETLVTTLTRMIGEGLPVRGVCWYSRGDQYDWDSMLTEPVGTVTTVGLFDADRHPRAVAERFAQLARGT